MAQILVLGSPSHNPDVISRVLRRAGHDIHEDSLAASALRAAARRAFDAAIVDQDLPGAGGLRFLERLRALRPKTARLLTAERSDDPEVVSLYQQGTIARVLRRPFSDADVLRAVEGALTLQERYAELARVQRMAAEAEEQHMLGECFAQDALDVALQPIVSAREAGAFGFEFLLRSRHPALQSPFAVLQAAARFDKISELADRIAERVAHWSSLLPSSARLFVNVHPEELSSVSTLERRLQTLSPEQIVLELTQIRTLGRITGWEEAVARIQALGFSISVDDLGDNYGAVGMLSTLRPAFLKADMSITRGVDVDPAKRRLVGMMCRFAEAAGARLVAEGVETPAEAEALRALGVPLMQGYLFGRPSMRPAEVFEWLRAPPAPKSGIASVA